MGLRPLLRMNCGDKSVFFFTTDSSRCNAKVQRNTFWSVSLTISQKDIWLIFFFCHKLLLISPHICCQLLNYRMNWSHTEVSQRSVSGLSRQSLRMSAAGIKAAFSLSSHYWLLFASGSSALFNDQLFVSSDLGLSRDADQTAWETVFSLLPGEAADISHNVQQWIITNRYKGQLLGSFDCSHFGGENGHLGNSTLSCF